MLEAARKQGERPYAGAGYGAPKYLIYELRAAVIALLPFRAPLPLPAPVPGEC